MPTRRSRRLNPFVVTLDDKENQDPKIVIESKKRKPIDDTAIITDNDILSIKDQIDKYHVIQLANPSAWIDDVVIIELLRRRIVNVIPTTLLVDTIVWNKHFKLPSSWGPTKAKGQSNLLTYPSFSSNWEMAFVPTFVNDNHWILAVIHRHPASIVYYDTMHKPASRHTISKWTAIGALLTNKSLIPQMLTFQQATTIMPAPKRKLTDVDVSAASPSTTSPPTKAAAKTPTSTAVVPSPKRKRLSKPTVVALSSYTDFNDPTLNFQPKVFALYEIPVIRTVNTNKGPTQVINLMAFDRDNKSLEIGVWGNLATTLHADCSTAEFPIKAMFKGTYIKKERNRWSLNVDSDWPVAIRIDGSIEIVEQTNEEAAPSETSLIEVKKKIAGSKSMNIMHKNIRLEIFSDAVSFGGETMCDVSDGVFRARLVTSKVPFNLENGVTIRLNTFKAQFESVTGSSVFTLKPLSPIVQLFPVDDNDPVAVKYSDDDLEAIPFIQPDN
uniref:ULP_PROTEASE domain-containing protein n=1 Tax=Panagrellus redivivus TaxID=6233 RepID=A0A7E4W9T9_PANRE